MADSRIDMGGKNSGWVEQALPITVNAPVVASTVSGDVVLIGDMVGYAQGDRDANGYAPVMTPCTHAQVVSVVGNDDGGAAAIVFGNKLYYDNAIPEINIDAVAGIPFGYAFGAVGSGETAEILVGFGL